MNRTFFRFARIIVLCLGVLATADGTARGANQVPDVLARLLASGRAITAATAYRSKAQGAVSIAEFGAELSATDNSSAIQRALDANSKVFVPAGTWKIASALRMNNSQTIYGPGVIERTGPGYILTAVGRSNITVATNFKGDPNSWAISLKGVNSATVIGCHASEVMLVETDSTSGDYTSTTPNNMSHNIVIADNVGLATAKPNAVSQQFIRVLYARGFWVTNNSASGYRDFILAWGGDYKRYGASANERKVYDGLVNDNSGTVLAAGIWTAMARDVRIVGNRVLGSNGAEGLDAEGSDNVSFVNNEAINFTDGVSLFGVNKDITFSRNKITASVNAFRNANNQFEADYGAVVFDGNTFSSTVEGCIGGLISAAGRVRFVNNVFENVELKLSDGAIAGLLFEANRLYYDYPPSGLWHARFGGLTQGYIDQPAMPQIVVKGNHLEWRGKGGLSPKRGFGLTSSRVSHEIIIEDNEFVRINEQLSYEGSKGPMTVLVRHNIFDAAGAYPSVLHGSPLGLTVTWQDNVNNDGQDAYGHASPRASFFSEGSRIWSNSDVTHRSGWVFRSGGWRPMSASN